MAGRLLIVVDTGYWVELFQIPKHSSEQKYQRVKDKFAWAIEPHTASLYFPLPCVYELANHIAHIENGNDRKKLAKKLQQTLAPDSQLPIIVHPACAVDELQNFLRRFAENYVLQGLGLVDAAVIDTAVKVKQKQNKVHIWTLDKQLKANEPDKEEDAFVGEG